MTPPDTPKKPRRAQAREVVDTGDGARGAYPMRVVTRLTGLNPDTIRAWERRYSAISPERTGGNTRLFSPADVRRLVLLKDVVALGHPVSRVAGLDTPSLERLLKDDEQQGSSPREEPVVQAISLQRLADEYLGLVDAFAVRKARDFILRATALLPTRDLMLTVVEPILSTFAARWGDDPDGEARKQLVRLHVRAAMTSIRPFHPVERGAPRVVAASPVGAQHDLGLLASSVFAAMRGFELLYVGAGLSADALVYAVEELEPSIVMLGVDASLDREQRALRDAVLGRVPPRIQLWLGTEASTGPVDPPNVRRFPSFEALDLALVDVLHRA
ncbi:MAG: MerR family transcriptional regulator [Deltaproteobacteria bacterium]|nr:MerR family transcriptional regulator [Deltaproteobacteria bacterium]